MIKDDTKQLIKFGGWLIGLILVIYLATIAIFAVAGRTKQTNDHEVYQLAVTKSPIKTVENYYHLNRGTNSYAVQGKDSQGEIYYFLYLPNSKRAIYYAADEGVSEKTVKSEFMTKYPSLKISKVELGWYKGKAAWEVTCAKSNGGYSYALYDFKSGKQISVVANL